MTVRRRTEGRLDRDEKMREEHAWRDHCILRIQCIRCASRCYDSDEGLYFVLGVTKDNSPSLNQTDPGKYSSESERTNWLIIPVRIRLTSVSPFTIVL